jgi:hypothetical protein
MGQLLSFKDARADRLKARLCDLADSRSAAVVETPDGPIDAYRIFCRDTCAVLIDRYGVQTRLGYGEISDVSPMLPASEIIRLADWQVVSADEQPNGATVLRFPDSRAG